jgi:hypothetical protein
MSHLSPSRSKAARSAVLICIVAIAFFSAAILSARAQDPSANKPVMLDRVIAVVNDRAILESDLLQEMRVSVLEPNGAGNREETPQAALERLISRTLIRQQIRVEDAEATTPTAQEIADRIAAMRKQLPICVRENCASDEGWKAFLVHHELTQQEVVSYLRNRLGILRFIEMRVRQGIQIAPDEIQTYYHDTLVPQYRSGQAAPPLDQVAPRIQEILLQQKVSAMFSGWLDNLRKQGEVEVLDPSLEAAATQSQEGAGAP